MGLAAATLGLTNGLVLFVLPQLMAAEQIPESRIAVITAAAVSPNFWVVFFGPMLDVRFSRRWYATVFAAFAGVFVAISILSLHRVTLLATAAMLANACSSLSGSAVGGWFSNIVDQREKIRLSKWMNIALICGMGVASTVGGEFVRHLPIALAAASLAALVFLPTSIFVLLPSPEPDRRLAAESFAQFNREVLSLFRRREVVIVLLLFLSPCGSFALTNLLGGLGADFHASAREISLAGGVGEFVPGIIGCFLFPVIARRLPLRSFYLATGVLGSIFTLSLILLPHLTWTFALAVFGEFLFQAISFSIQIGIVFEVIGPGNPLAATTFAFLTAATNVPVTYMVVFDGRAYSAAGIAGAFTVDAAISILTCLIAGLLMYRLDRKPLAAGQTIRLAEEKDN
jgi:MFS transporter, PAT family, beta-lactamase induction signal transducer AmpG